MLMKYFLMALTWFDTKSQSSLSYVSCFLAQIKFKAIFKKEFETIFYIKEISESLKSYEMITILH